MTTPEEHNPEHDIGALEQDLHVSPGFFRELLEQGDDWSFVIRIHALVEAAVSHLLAEVIGHPEMVSLFAQLELSNAKTGKLAFAKELSCLESSERLTIRKLSELRNQLVHNVSNVSFDFRQWAAGLDSNQAKQYCEAFGPLEETVEIGGKQITGVNLFKKHPREFVWMACLFLLSLIYQRKDLARRESELTRSHVDLARRLITGTLFDRTS